MPNITADGMGSGMAEVIKIERAIGTPSDWRKLFTPEALAELQANHAIQKRIDRSLTVEPVTWLALIQGGERVVWEAMLSECDADGYADGLVCISYAEPGSVWLPEIVEATQGGGFDFIERTIPTPKLRLFDYSNFSMGGERILTAAA